MIPFHIPDICEQEIDAVTDVLRSGWLTTGPVADRLEKKFEIMTGKHAVAFSSATMAQLCGMRALMDVYELPSGLDVVVSGLTFPSTVQNCMHLGMNVQFADIDRVTLQPTAETIAAALSNPRLVVVTHYGGYPCPMDDIRASFIRALIVDDASHCLPTRLKQWQAGEWPSDMTFFSFYATKTVCAGEGGMAVFDSQEVAELARKYSRHGRSNGGWDYSVDVTGYKANLPDVLAAIADVQLKRMEIIYERRKSIAEKYHKNIRLVHLPADSSSINQSHHLYPVVLHERHSRDRFIRRMAKYGVECSAHFPRLYMEPCWKGEQPNVPVLGSLSGRLVSLPIFSRMTEKQVDDVIGAVERAILET